MRMIDAEKYMKLLKEQYLHHKSMGNSQAAKAWQGAMQLLYDMPTLTPPNEPLTIEQLREMDGEPAWWDDGEGSCWGIISVATNGRWAGIPFFRGRWKQANFEYDIKSRGMTLYRRPPEGEEK